MPEVRSAELCWGQRYHWLRYQRVPEGTRHDVHSVGSFPLAEGLSVADVQATVNYLVRRHEVLRTVFDAGALPWPKQRVQPPGALPLVVATTEQDGTPTPVEAVRALSRAEFDLERDWPMRVGVITTGGAPKRLVLVFNHVGFDDWCLETFWREFETVLGAVSARRRAVLAPVLCQPADLARRESGRPAADNARVMEHWRAQLASAPADMFARRRAAARTAPAGGAEAYSAAFVSPELREAVREVAARYRVWPSAVHLAAYAVAMAAYTGAEVITPQVLISNRETGEQLSVMTCMFAPSPVPVDLTGAPDFGEVVRRASAALDLAQQHSYVAYDEIVDLAACEGFRRGRRVTTGSELNFLNRAGVSCGSRRERLTRHATPAEWARSGSDVYVTVYEWSDGVTLGLQSMARVMEWDDVERFLRGYANLLAAHRDPGTDLTAAQAAELFGFSALPTARVLRVGPDAVDADACEALLRAHPAVRAARVGLEPRGLVAEVEAEFDAADRGAAHGPLTPARLRAHVLGALDQYPSAACPAWFRVTGSPGAPPIEGDGRERLTDLDEDAAARALASVVAVVNGLGAVDLALSYAAAGGRVLRIPRVLTQLRTAGWDGVSMDALCGIRPLSALAAAMSPAG